MAFYGRRQWEYQPKPSTHVIVAAWPGELIWSEALEKGISVKTSSYSRHHVNVTMCKAKLIGNYMNSILAHQEAITDGYNEALCLIRKDMLPKDPVKYFLVKNGKLITPSLSSA